ncbi:YeaH/YhbH family protein [Klebsiella pneumoniae]|nr:YeaH/YhbH family protein [Klebsiella pneumoniae]
MCRTAGEENSAGGALYSYIEVPAGPRCQTLWRGMNLLQATFDNFAMQHIRDGRISTRYSANCFTTSHLKVKLN